MWTLAFGHQEDRTPTHGYAETREAGYVSLREELAAGVSDQASGASEARFGRCCASTTLRIF
jgi:hypothetical protein